MGFSRRGSAPSLFLACIFICLYFPKQRVILLRFGVTARTFKSFGQIRRGCYPLPILTITGQPQGNCADKNYTTHLDVLDSNYLKILKLIILQCEC
jgi:hypothetical protein